MVVSRFEGRGVAMVTLDVDSPPINGPTSGPIPHAQSKLNVGFGRQEPRGNKTWRNCSVN